jgi:membrane protease subunit HflK
MSNDLNNSSNSDKNSKRKGPKKFLLKIKNSKLKKLKADEIFQKLKIHFLSYVQNEESTVNDIKKAFEHVNPKRAAAILGVSLFAIYILTGVYIVNPGEQAVIRRFGGVLPQVASEGIHYSLPFPIDQVQKVNVSEVRRADVGMNLPEHIHQADDSPQSVQLLTGDENIISTEAIVHYKVNDAVKFLYNVNGNSEQLVRYSVESALVRLIANMAVDNILSTEKVQAQNFVMRQAQQTLDLYNAGIQITAFNIQAIVPPDAVADAFRNVTNAKEEKETSINEANGYYNSQIPNARAEANKMISQAETYKIEQVNKATGDAGKFLSMLQEYQNNSKIYSKDTTKYRLLLETLDKIMPKVKKYIVDSADGSVDVKMFDPSLTNDASISSSSSNE